MKTLSYTQARQNLKSVFDSVNENASPVFIKRRNGKGVIILSEEEFFSLDETAYLLSNPKNRKHLEESIQEKERGEVVEVSLNDL